MNDLARDIRKHEKKLYNTIQHERFSLKKILHILEYGYICESIYSVK